MIVVVRHGETAPNRSGRLLGRADPDLTDHGRQQARRLAGALGGRGAEAVVSSPLARCRATAEVIAERSALEVVTDERLVEIDYGEWDGRAHDEVDPDEWSRWRHDASFRPPRGESLLDVRARVVSWCEEQLDREGTVVAVTHVSPVKAAVAWALGVDPLISWRTFVGIASITRIGVRSGEPVLVSFNERGHLDVHEGG